MSTAWWLPPAVSRHAIAHDAQLLRTTTAAATIFIMAQAAILLIAWWYRSSRNGKAGPAGALSSRIEVLSTATTAVLFLGLLALGRNSWAGVQFTSPPPGAEPVQVLARQFAWNFRYPGIDARFGRTDVRLVNEAAGNPFGLDDADPAAKDDIVSATLRVPAGRPVTLTLHSLDVIHSFFVRELRVKQDVVPGMDIPLHFQAEIPGTYEIPCAELCGLGHHQMRTTVIVMRAADFDAWKRGQHR